MATFGESKFGQQIIWDGQPPIELRFEVLHQPPQEMWEAMMAVNPGMAIAGEDKVLNELEAYAAELTGKEAAMFLPTTTNGMVLAHMNRDLRGKQVIMEASCHIFWVEDLHVSDLSGAMPRLIRGDKFGAMDCDEVEEVIASSCYGHTVPVGMIDLENTHNVYGGTVLTPEYTEQMAELAHRNGADLFLDGARVATAAVAQGVPIRALTEPADHIAIIAQQGFGRSHGGGFVQQCRIYRRGQAAGEANRHDRDSQGRYIRCRGSHCADENGRQATRRSSPDSPPGRSAVRG